MTEDSVENQHNTNTAVKGAFFAGIRFFLSTLISFPIAILLVRLFSPRQFGYLVVASAIASLLTSLIGSGLGTATSKLISREKSLGNKVGENNVLAVAFRIAFATTCIGTVLALLVAFLIYKSVNSGSAVAIVFLVLVPPMLLNPLSHVATGYLGANANAKRVETAHLMGSILYLFGIIVVLFTSKTALEVAIVRSISMIISYFYIIIKLKLPSRSGALKYKEFVSNSFTALLNTLTFSAINRLDVTVLGTEVSVIEGGLYSPISNFTTMAQSMAALPSTYFLPEASAAVVNGSRSALINLYSMVTRTGIVLGTPLIALLAGCPAALFSLLLGTRYENLGTPARILALGAAVQVVTGPNGSVLFAYGRLRQISIRSTFVLASSVLACLVLIPIYKIEGAALATTIPLALGNIYNSIAIYKVDRIVPLLKPWLLLCGGLVISTLISLLLSLLLTNNLLIVCASLAVGGSCQIILFLCTKSDLEDAQIASLRRKIRR